MLRATSIVAASHRHGRPIVDTVILDYAQRSANKVAVTGVKGTVVDVDLHEAARLRTDDLLLLDDGSLVEVVAASEPLLEARATEPAGLMRLAWHLGDRHVPVQVLPNRVRVRRDGEVEKLLRSLGAKLLTIEAPFEPEGGAYEGSRAHGYHGHDHHDHGHSHHHHD